ncbi:D-alanyl-D-alaninecarboxypeptidase/D-alanyl-D-alanine-endopeptidase [Oceanicola granulosus HTCC2516]|uniref:D-alanyl-D-alaninecarboxypeptidase/D-alanyl-D-alanine-endopeptidase n=1 Tax=Oceanicola granulosus (strain ATCC BAA-861 / DSM 15982 / KCTC 12143 / HTCC2516) TaxID=314256 RepID=Q2CEY9_OCEGH|nr:D-alanyl-D-alanine carboxypeptidase/D-alanyl-D-alanine-endopeptidase [Oceanicola granulosus]EAR51221.1 D-alanyl-D-alaninecarboxypeptidase/D-alanyl-D-alanine-endopeptidase [Oceanicola granulosus HTCC2516]
MAGHLSRRAFLGTLAAAAGQAALADAPLRSLHPRLRPDGAGGAVAFDPGATAPAVRPSLEQIVENSRVLGSVSAAVADIETGELIEGYAADEGLPPASVTKAMTALYALETLGPDYRFTTRLVALGEVREGVLEGDLALVGGGDPTLGSNNLGDLAKALKAAGITEVAGRFLVWGGALPHEHEIDTDQLDHLGYNPAISGLNLNYNRVHFAWARSGSGYDVTMEAVSEGYAPAVATSRMTVEDRTLPVYTYASRDDIDEWTVARRQLGDGGARWLPVREPALYAGDVFRTIARSEGIELDAAELVEEAPEGTEIARHDSAPLVTILEEMLLYSTNLTAEVVGLSATRELHGRPDSLLASAQAMNDWLRDTYGVTSAFVDHSGLGDRSRIGAGEMVKMFVAPGVMDKLRPILKRHVLKDDAGAPIDGYPATVRAKTGTLNFVSALGGYITTAEGKTLAFSIICGELEAREAGEASGDEIPDGARPWNARARRLQQDLLQRWGLVYTEEPMEAEPTTQ